MTKVGAVVTGIFALLAVGCDGGATTSGDGGAPLGAGTRITLTNVTAAPVSNLSWVAFQDGDGPWQTVDGKAGVYVFTVRGPRYGLAFVCDRAGWLSGEVLHATVAELPSLATSCDLMVDRPIFPLGGALKGVPASAAISVFVGSVGGVQAAQVTGTSYTLPVEASTYDVTALAQEPGKPDRVVVRRGVLVGAPTTLDLDFAAEGRSGVEQPLVVKNTAVGETLEGSLEIQFASNGYLYWDLTGPSQASYRALAETDLGKEDAQQLSVLAVTGTPPTLSVRGASRGFRAPGPLELTLPPAFSSARLSLAATAPHLRPRLEFDTYGGARFFQLQMDRVSGTESFGWLAIFSADWLGEATSYDFPDFSGARGFEGQWAFGPQDTLQVESYAVRSSRALLPTISAERRSLAGAQLEFAKTVSLLRAP
jgi:hypothetical protein